MTGPLGQPCVTSPIQSIHIVFNMATVKELKPNLQGTYRSDLDWNNALSRFDNLRTVRFSYGCNRINRLRYPNIQEFTADFEALRIALQRLIEIVPSGILVEFGDSFEVAYEHNELVRVDLATVAGVGSDQHTISLIEMFRPEVPKLSKRQVKENNRLRNRAKAAARVSAGPSLQKKESTEPTGKDT